MQTLESLNIAMSMKGVLDNDLQAELSAHSLYTEAATHCHSVKNYVSRDLFERLIHDEEEHIDFFETQVELVGSALTYMPSTISENSTSPNHRAAAHRIRLPPSSRASFPPPQANL